MDPTDDLDPFNKILAQQAQAFARPETEAALTAMSIAIASLLSEMVDRGLMEPDVFGSMLDRLDRAGGEAKQEGHARVADKVTLMSLALRARPGAQHKGN